MERFLRTEEAISVAVLPKLNMGGISAMASLGTFTPVRLRAVRTSPLAYPTPPTEATILSTLVPGIWAMLSADIRAPLSGAPISMTGTLLSIIWTSSNFVAVGDIAMFSTLAPLLGTVMRCSSFWYPTVEAIKVYSPEGTPFRTKLPSKSVVVPFTVPLPYLTTTLTKGRGSWV